MAALWFLVAAPTAGLVLVFFNAAFPFFISEEYYARYDYLELWFAVFCTVVWIVVLLKVGWFWGGKKQRGWPRIKEILERLAAAVGLSYVFFLFASKLAVVLYPMMTATFWGEEVSLQFTVDDVTSPENKNSGSRLLCPGYTIILQNAPFSSYRKVCGLSLEATKNVEKGTRVTLHGWGTRHGLFYWSSVGVIPQY